MAFALHASTASATLVAQRGDGLFLVEGSSSQKIFNKYSRGMGVSPDGQEVVFAPGEGQHNGDLMIYNIPEEDTTVVSSSEDDGMYWKEPRFAPSGTQIVAVSDHGLYSIDTDGTHVRRLTGNSGAPSWPVMSRSGHLAYLDESRNLWILDPTDEGEASEPRLIAKASEYEGTVAFPPSFAVSGTEEGEEEEECGECNEEESRPGQRSSPEESDLLLYSTNKDNYLFDVETGTLVSTYGFIQNGAEWSTLSPGSLLEHQYRNIYTVNWTTGEREFLGSTPEGVEASVLWVRSNQPAGEVNIPHAAIPIEELLSDFTPYLKYDSQEPYGVVGPSAITGVYGWDEGHSEISYTNELKRGSRVLAQPPDVFEEEEVKYDPKGLFALTLDSLAPTYPAFGPPDEDAEAQSEDFIDEHNDTHMNDSAIAYTEDADKAAGVFRPGAGGPWLQYWLFYYYNNGTLGFNDHEGDWEMIQIHLNPNTGYLPSEVVYAQHSHGSRCLPGEYDTEGIAPGPGGAPVIYVGNGGHASYPEEGEWETDFPLVADSAYPNLEERPSVQVSLYSTEESWFYWPGIWGGSGASPRGPRFQGTRWDDPGGWAEEAQGCHDGKISGRAARGSGSKASVALRTAVIRGKSLDVGYVTTSTSDDRRGWPKMLLSVDALADRLPPKTITVSNVALRGHVVMPVRLDRSKKWRVRASVVTKHGRSPVVARNAVRKASSRTNHARRHR